MRAYVLTTPFHVAKMASHDDNAHTLPYVDDGVAAREEDYVAVENLYEASTDVEDEEASSAEDYSGEDEAMLPCMMHSVGAVRRLDTCTWAAYPTVWRCPTTNHNRKSHPENLCVLMF